MGVQELKYIFLLILSIALILSSFNYSNVLYIQLFLRTIRNAWTINYKIFI